MRKVLVAGATGQLGRHVCGELKRRGYSVRALVRDERRLGATRGDVDETFVGDLVRPETLRGACAGVDAVISAAAAPLSLDFRERGATHRSVDYLGNRNLLAEAVAAGAGKFVYVSVFGAQRMRGLDYVDAHEEFVEELKRSGISYAVVRPTGFFSAMGEILKMARRGPVMSIGEGDSRTNPIHEADLAVVCADALEGTAHEVEAGGPETYTRRELAELAFEALGKKPRLVRVPARLFAPALLPLKLFHPRLHALMLFFVAVAQIDAVAPAHGRRSLRTYFRELAQR